MVFPDDLDESRRARDEVRDEARKNWLDEEEREQIAEGDISVSETVDGHDPTPDLDDFDERGSLRDEGIYVGDIENMGGSGDPVDHYLEDDGASDDYPEDDELENETLDPRRVDIEEATLDAFEDDPLFDDDGTPLR